MEERDAALAKSRMDAMEEQAKSAKAMIDQRNQAETREASIHKNYNSQIDDMKKCVQCQNFSTFEKWNSALCTAIYAHSIDRKHEEIVKKIEAEKAELATTTKVNVDELTRRYTAEVLIFI